MLMWVHPVWQSVAFVAALGALYHGWQRVRTRHFKQVVRFAWKTHVQMGLVALGMWVVGGIVGLVVARMAWGAWLMSGVHGEVGLVFVLLAVFGLGTGLCLDRHRKNRTVLPVLHGAGNVVLVALFLWQVVTGVPLLP